MAVQKKWTRYQEWIKTALLIKHPSPQAKTLQQIILYALFATILYALSARLWLNNTPVDTLWYLIGFIFLYVISRTRFHFFASIALVVMLMGQPLMIDSVILYQQEILIPIIASMSSIPITIMLFRGRIQLWLVIIVCLIEIAMLGIMITSSAITLQIGIFLFLIAIGIPIVYWLLLSPPISRLQSGTHSHHQLVDVSPDMMAIIVQGNFAYINDAGLQLLKIQNNADILRKPLSYIIPQNDDNQSDSNSLISRYHSSGKMVVESAEIINRPDGSIFRGWVTLMPFEFRGTMATYLTVKAIPRHVDNPSLILESATVLTSVLQDGKIVYVNNYFERLTGFSRQEVYSASYSRFQFTYIDDRKRVSEWIDKIREGTHETNTIDYRMYHKSGDEIWVRSTGSMIQYAGKPALLTTTIDITSYMSHSPSDTLDEEVQRYQAMFDMMNDYAFILKVTSNIDYELEWASSAFEMVTGYNLQRDTNHNILHTLYHPEDQPIISNHYQQLLRGEMSVSEHRIQSKSGDTRWVREHAYPVVVDGRTTSIYGSVRDITDYIKSEETLSNLALQQAMIAEIGETVANANLDINEFIQQILKLVTELMDVPLCVLIEHDTEKSKFVLHSMIGQPQGQIEADPQDTTSYLGYVLYQNTAVVVRDWSNETRFKRPTAYDNLKIQSSLSVVVPMQEHAFGILSVHDRSSRQFSSEYINLLQTIANLFGMYIQQHQIQQAEQKQRMMAEALIDIATILNSQHELDEIFHTILGFVSQIVPVVDSSNIMILDKERGIVKIVVRHQVNKSIPEVGAGQEIPLESVPLFTKIMETGRPIILNNIEQAEDWYIIPETAWIKSNLGAPIFAGTESIGIVSLDSAQLNAFTEEHAKQLHAFLNQANIAIQNARYAENLTQEVEKRTQELQAEQAQLQAILGATGEGIFYSHESKILFANKVLAEMMGYPLTEILGKSSHMFRPDDLSEDELQVREMIKQQIRDIGFIREEIRFQRKDGSIFIGEVTASRIQYHDDHVEAVTVIRDVSREKAIEAQKETFISNAAHELRAPITTLNTRMYLMKNKDTIENDDIQKIDIVVQKMNALVSGLLDWSRFEHGRIQLNLQSVILQDILNEVLDYQLPEAQKKQIIIKYHILEEPINMIADSLRLNQVVTNLISNAINYSPNESQIEIIVGYMDSTYSAVKINVMDNGIGIDEESLKTIFQPFSQAHNNTTGSGTGLGLSISKQIVDAHGGKIEVESVEGEGSHFTVYLPVEAIQADDK